MNFKQTTCALYVLYSVWKIWHFRDAQVVKLCTHAQLGFPDQGFITEVSWLCKLYIWLAFENYMNLGLQ